MRHLYYSMKWLVILIIFVVGGAIIGFLFSDDKDKGSGCLTGALAGLFQGGSCLIQLLFYILMFMIAVWIFS